MMIMPLCDEWKTLYCLVDDTAPEEEQPAVIASYKTSKEAEEAYDDMTYFFGLEES